MTSSASAQTELIALEHVSMSFGNSAGVHQDISITIRSGEVVVILGPSGTGKTVLLKLMIGLLCPTAGRVLLEGRDMAQLSPAELRERRLNIGMLFQGAALFDSLTVGDNVAFALRERGDSNEDEISTRVDETLAIVGLPEMREKFPTELSGGQRKRVGLARALATHPKVLLFDEPTTGLDPTSRNLIDSLIIKLRDDLAITSIVVTHDVESTRHIADRIILIGNGTVLADGPAATLLRENDLVRAFTSGRWKNGNHLNVFQTESP